MEFIGAIIVLFLIAFLWGIVVNVIGWGANAAGRSIKKAVTGKETYFGPAQLKLLHEMGENSKFTVKRIMFRGAIPNDRPMRLSYTLSAFDITDSTGPWRPLFSFVEAAQEPDTICFQASGDLGHLNTGMAMTDWVQLGIMIPEFVQPPESGNRKLSIVLRVFNSDHPPTIFAGIRAPDDGEIILEKQIVFTHNFSEKGYEEESRDRESAQAIALQIGVAIAMADGSLDDAEGRVLRNWILKEVAAYSESEQARLKALYNDALRTGFEAANQGTLDVDRLVGNLAAVGNKKGKYEAIELALDVMAADGVADPEEMRLIRGIASSLDLDMAEIERMREGVTLNLSNKLDSEESIEGLLGIDANWPVEQKRRHLRMEFQKWSNRLNSLPEGEERDSAQTMLDNIATLRSRYG